MTVCRSTRDLHAEICSLTTSMPSLLQGSLSAGSGAVVITTGMLHRFWDMSGGARTVEQAIFMAQLGIAAALLQAAS